ncbi:hypothetical protein OHB35_52870 [Streptomyces phaeochromogenes]|uniref:AB hydrolase-1 domain-containing protein n=1 Tax=Streptomyces phaeochromogenes TaxID=1923 RepID=A0ABZ1HRK2_STRPH|nr:hypothetical protein [Streptomyces phaeochromogenes]WSD21239.1 hypothetical protein OHB35_52870 [Streptomyces phaeochromogenes]
MTSVVLVHGTGVRVEDYDKLFDLVGRRLDELDSGAKLLRCLWGEDHGARLNRGGVSIPRRRADVQGPHSITDLPDVRGEHDASDAVWSLLDIDPLAELRILGETEAAQAAPYLPQQDETSAEQLILVLKGLPGHPAVREQAALHGLTGSDLESAARSVSDVLQSLLLETSTPIDDLRHVVSRAVVAVALDLADMRWGQGGMSVDRATVEALQAAVLEALGEPGTALGWFSDLTKPAWLPFWRTGEWLTSWQVRRKRPGVSAQVAPPIGDILRYQARGEGLRDCIADAVRAAEPPVVVLAHSLGGVAGVDLFARQDYSELVSALVTVGSQAPFLYEMDALSSLPYGQPLPAHFPRWLNAYDPRDPLAYVGAPIFGTSRVTDKEFNTGRPLLRAHSAYWDHQPFYAWLQHEVLG